MKLPVSDESPCPNVSYAYVITDSGHRLDNLAQLKVGFVIEGEFQQAVAPMQIQFAADVQPVVLNGFKADLQ